MVWLPLKGGARPSCLLQLPIEVSRSHFLITRGAYRMLLRRMRVGIGGHGVECVTF